MTTHTNSEVQLALAHMRGVARTWDGAEWVTLTRHTVRGKNRYRVQGVSRSGRGYQDFVFGDTEAQAREGAIRERGFRYVTCLTLMPDNA